MVVSSRKKIVTPLTRSIDSVRSAPLSFRKQGFLYRVLGRIQSFKGVVFRKYPKLKTLSIACLIGLIIPFSFRHAHADVASFYPTTCLGGWQQVNNATGAPSVTESYPHFSAENSALLTPDTQADIFCGKFDGDVPQGAVPSQFTLSMVWRVSDVSLPSVDSFAPSTVSPVQESSSAVHDSSLEQTVAPAELPSEVQTEATPDPVPVEIPEQAVSVESSWLDRMRTAIVRQVVAYAQDEAPAAPEAVSPAVSPDQESAPPSETDESLIATEIAPGEHQVPEVIDPLFMISVTLDGTSWHDLGMVGRKTIERTSFVLPSDLVSTWEDTADVQVKITPVDSIDTRPYVYLDSMILSVSYDKHSLEQEYVYTDEVTSITETPDQYVVYGVRDDKPAIWRMVKSTNKYHQQTFQKIDTTGMVSLDPIVLDDAILWYAGEGVVPHAFVIDPLSGVRLSDHGPDTFG